MANINKTSKVLKISDEEGKIINSYRASSSKHIIEDPILSSEKDLLIKTDRVKAEIKTK